jgi:lipopolysaccharide transport system ATP-binding protein
MATHDRDTVIRVEDVHKRYRLGVIGSSLLSDEVKALWAGLRGRPDPRMPLKNAELQQRMGAYFWSLRGVSFEVGRGETLGIVGRNGAGKSTMLRLLSRITLPTKGLIRMRGKVSSLLEVGTGFHPELTGLENVHLNGAILGMRRAEIDKQLDAIIAFSGIEHHIDTPIKRYSTGMKVRLGFAVAAHLDPDILIVDEVLAVGDAEFQRRCIARMREVATSGRTVLFVSHAMDAVEGLCERVIWMDQGRVRQDGPTREVVHAYAREGLKHDHSHRWEPGHAPGGEGLALMRLEVPGSLPDGSYDRDRPLQVDMRLQVLEAQRTATDLLLQVYTDNDVLAFSSTLGEGEAPPRWEPGLHRITCTIPPGLLNTGGYRIALTLLRNDRPWVNVEDTLRVELRDTRPGALTGPWAKGAVWPRLDWRHDLLEHG